MNRPENRLGGERFARFSRSRAGLNESLSHSTRQTTESDLTMAVSCYGSGLTALVIAQGVIKLGDESPRKTPVTAHGYAHRAFT
eukprot:1686232-Pleurochrysis_carterae.AAC.1